MRVINGRRSQTALVNRVCFFFFFLSLAVLSACSVVKLSIIKLVNFHGVAGRVGFGIGPSHPVGLAISETRVRTSRFAPDQNVVSMRKKFFPRSMIEACVRGYGMVG
ncbi:hypothetical protein B0J18DRAFT_432547 [Chaetomium sp. MPI-SDFR-AT-0129]|nr:hypothetical protein B0J18DRAFT_432547 [Chaetomium sp. MPI-SDFR-AT-0129]